MKTAGRVHCSHNYMCIKRKAGCSCFINYPYLNRASPKLKVCGRKNFKKKKKTSLVEKLWTMENSYPWNVGCCIWFLTYESSLPNHSSYVNIWVLMSYYVRINKNSYSKITSTVTYNIILMTQSSLLPSLLCALAPVQLTSKCGFL